MGYEGESDYTPTRLMAEGRRAAVVSEPAPRLFDLNERHSSTRTPYPGAREELRRISQEEDGDDELWSQPEALASMHRPPTLDMEEPETVLGEGITIKGEIQFRRFLRIDGSFEGSKISGEGKLVVGPTGMVKSDIELSEVIIEGSVEGNVTADRLELRGDAKLVGGVRARLMAVDEGATLSGQIEVSPSEGN